MSGFPPSKSYGVQQPLATDTQATSAFPQPAEVLVEVGLLLAVHLAAVLAVTLTLRAFGI